MISRCREDGRTRKSSGTERQCFEEKDSITARLIHSDVILLHLRTIASETETKSRAERDLLVDGNYTVVGLCKHRFQHSIYRNNLTFCCAAFSSRQYIEYCRVLMFYAILLGFLIGLFEVKIRKCFRRMIIKFF